MMYGFGSLRVGGPTLLALAFGAGVLSAGLWAQSTSLWDQHLMRAQHVGETLFDVVQSGVALPAGITAPPVSPGGQVLAEAGEFEQLTDVPRPPLVTNLAVNVDPADVLDGETLTLAIISSGLRYPVSELDLSRVASAREVMGKVTALLANYCSDAVIFARLSGDDGPWQRFDGAEVWGCGARPADSRLLAALLGVIAFIGLSSVAAGAASQFSGFADRLRGQRSLGRSAAFDAAGPLELQDIIRAVNDHADLERQHLADRALVLSGVSHDLGTPATRLKLRAELIEDPDLRRRFEADIDQMTGIIESVLTYTRAELNTEEPRQLSLASLVDSVVADFADVGRPVTFDAQSTIVMEGGQSIFMSRRGRSELRQDAAVVVLARPIALRRALSNLIDNALKYGRRAVVHLETDPERAHILVEDEGGQGAIADLDRMIAPFQRGENAKPIAGYGMGLTIASTIALAHGGGLSFDAGRHGVIARLSIARV